MNFKSTPEQRASSRTRYTVTCIDKTGLRIAIRRNASEIWDTREDAEAWLKACFENTGEDKLVSVFGEQSRGTFRVDAFECWDNGDTKGIYVEEE